MLMVWTIVFVILGLAIAAAAALVRGLMAFLRDGQALKEGDASVVGRSGAKQNRMMVLRVFFQGLAIAAIAVLGVVLAQD